MARAALLLCLALSTAPAVAGLVPLGPCGPVDRRFDPLEVRGRELRLGGPPIARLGIIAFRDGVAVPIPFQIDERRGRKLALAGGPKPTDDDKPGVFDADDLAVFMACDAGTAASPAVLSKALEGTGATAWRQIRIEDPAERKTAFAYVVVAE